jgi:acetoin utilization deacetylase AcuC-like enzyme
VIRTAEIPRLKLLTAMVLEGGYHSSELGDNINSFIDGFENNFHKYDFQVVYKFS